jgi:hypothetical protein
MLHRTLGAVAVGLALAGFITLPSAHGAESARALRLQRVTVVMDPAGLITWPDMFADHMGGKAARDAARADPKAFAQKRSAVLKRISERTRAVLEPSLKATLSGPKPVTARVTVHAIYIPTVGSSMLATAFGGIGNPAGQSQLSVSVDFIDARGAVVLSYPKTAVTTHGGQKLNIGTSGVFSHDPLERLVATLDGQLKSWLLKT